ncbi:hypothetical protein ES288_A11G023200v1 [Gossypium darwinii]|uniref:MBD domain-containing protein n=1 Tax=Gossypium darwinii TaxID=34276 RepID=A0A5D2EGU0_GOSDA|nr:hypothetical protein ES288_A11G023200v1 [Gossypium darwinii]
MTEETSPDWLPAGWTQEFRFQKTGRRITHYVNLATGLKFFTKDDLIRYAKTETKTESEQCDDRLPTLKQITKPSTNSQVNAAVKENECPEWLPKNWFVEVKTHKSGEFIGKQVKIYVDPSTGLRFYSKPAVFRFLKQAEQRNRKTNKKKRAAHSRKKVVIEKSTVDDLPAGWIKEIKIRRNANGVRKDPYYTDPVSGYVFRSKKAVLHYLETGEIARSAFLPPKSNDDQNLTDEDGSQLPRAKRKKVKLLATKRQLVTGGETSDLSGLETEISEKGQIDQDCAETGLATERNPKTAEKSSQSSSIAHKASNGEQGKIVSADNMLASTAADDEKEKSNISSSDSGKSNNKKELDLPHGSSNQLDQLEPEQVASGLERVNPCQKEANSPCVLEKESPLQLNVCSNPELAKQPSAYPKVKSRCALVKTIKPIEDEDVLRKQPQTLEIEKTSDTKSEVQPMFSSDSCLEFRVNTPRGGVPHEDASAEGLVSTAASSVLQEKNLGKTRMESKRRNLENKNSSKVKKMKELDLPRRISKRLAGLEHELVGNEVSAEEAIQNTTRKSGKTEAKPTCVLADKATQQLNVGLDATVWNQASPAVVGTEINNISPHEDRTILAEQPQMLGTQDSDSKSDLHPFFCSDPCLEFAIKTLTGAIPLEDAINEGLVSAPIANIQPQKNLAETTTENSCCRKTLINTIKSKKKDADSQQRSSKRLAGHSPELMANSLSNEQFLNLAAQKSYDSKARNVNLPSANLTEKSSQQLEFGPRVALEHQDFTYRTNSSHNESSNKSKEPHQNQTIPTGLNNENPGGLPSAVPFGSLCSDPYFKFPFNTLTGSSAAEDSFTFQRNFALPDYGFPNIFQSDIPTQVFPVEQPVLQQQQQFPYNPPFLPPGNVSLPNSGTINAQQSYRTGKTNYQTR